MKKFLVLLIAAMFLAVGCGGGESKKLIEEKTVLISAADGGEIEVADGATKIKIPAGALKADKEISLKLYKTNGFDNKKALASNVVEFGPSGTVFEKPVLVTINAEKSVEGKTISAAVMRNDGSWSFSKDGVAVKLEGFDEAGDPIMTTAAGDPIMTDAQGNIMMDAGGDPIMLASAGDPIMVTAAGDPIMNAAAGDPIMMATGHFSTFTFVVVEEMKDENSGKVTCKTVKEWDKFYGEEEEEYDDEEVLCKTNGKEVVLCIKGDPYAEEPEPYSVKIGSKEFKCSGEGEDCTRAAAEYCGETIDDDDWTDPEEDPEGEHCRTVQEWDEIDGGTDGNYAEDDEIVVCKKTGEPILYCIEGVYDPDNSKISAIKIGEEEFECEEENQQECVLAMSEYCNEE